MINSNFEQSPPKKKTFFGVFFNGTFSASGPKNLVSLGPWSGPVQQLGVWWRTCWRQWIICTATGCCSAEAVAMRTFVFFSPHYPQQCEKKHGPAFFFSILSAWKTLPSTFLLEPSCSYCIFRPLGISAKTGMLESPLLFLVAIWAPKFKMWGSRTRCLEA